MRLSLIVTPSLAAFVIFLGCGGGKTLKKAEPAQTQTAAPAPDSGLTQATKDDLTQDELAQVNKVLKDLEDIPFDFDSYSIPTQGLDVIRRDIQILNDMLSARGKFIKLVLEGHTDERGTEDYNLALGERRAKTVKDYLLNAGFKDLSLKIITYGEERPKVAGGGEDSWAANRRVRLYIE